MRAVVRDAGAGLIVHAAEIEEGAVGRAPR
jgi:hypothetical protein